MSLRDVVMLWYLKCTSIGGVRREIRKKLIDSSRFNTSVRTEQEDCHLGHVPRDEALMTTRVNSMDEASSLEGFRG
jgi:hypothetical protein